MVGLLIFSLLLICIIIYFIANTETETETETELKDKEKPSEKLEKVLLVAKTKDTSKKFLSMNEMTRVFFFTENNSQAETFTKILEKNKKNVFSLMNKDKCFLNLKYTTFPKQEYDVSVSETIDNTSKLVIKKTRKNKLYIRFFNGYYLCIDSYDNLFASKDKTKVLFFSFKRF